MEEIVVKIKWDESLGPAWMKMDNLKSCLFSEIFIGGEAKDLVEVELRWRQK